MAYRARDDLFSHILDDNQVDDLIRMWKAGNTIKELSRHFNVHENTVTNIISRYVEAKRRE